MSTINKIETNIQEELDINISNVFSYFQDRYDCSGDITPEQSLEYDKAIEILTNILLTQINN